MNINIESLKKSNSKIIVFGDLMLDSYIWGKTSRISPESPVPIVHIQRETENLGGAGNVIANLRGLNIHAIPIGIIGADNAGDKIASKLKDIGCTTNFLEISKDKPTTQKTRIISNNQQIVRVDNESVDVPNSSVKDNLFSSLKENINDADAVIISDYGKGICEGKLIQKIIDLCSKSEINTFIDPKGVNFEKYRNASFITPNSKEASKVLNMEIDDEKNSEKACSLISEKYKIANVLITKGSRGMTLFSEGNFSHQKTKAKEVFDVSGAGDTVLATLAASISAGLDFITSMRLSNLAAGVTVSRLGTSPVNLEELESSVINGIDNFSISKILDFPELNRKIALWKSIGEKIIFTNGCFDLLHIGHISLLELAKREGTKLVVGLNSDESIKRIKGKDRPIVNQRNRSAVLSSIEFIDAICIFDEDTPIKLIKTIAPDCLVKGADYDEKDIVGSSFVKSYGGKISRIELVKDQSSSNIIETINNFK
tara:strand:+ start:1347 stop:2801 length:1455 start_codon:yes stop_codon:yes gene_type:complete